MYVEHIENEKIAEVFVKGLLLPNHIQHSLCSLLNKFVSYYSHLSKECIVQGGSGLQQSLPDAFSKKHRELVLSILYFIV